MDLKSWVIDLRRDFHRHPEPSWQEKRTAARVEEELASLGIPARRVAGTGVIGTLKGGSPGRTVALRADMDALQQEERTGLSFASENPGIMHACGHDAHTASLLGAARALAEERSSLRGTVVFLFQPAEELAFGAKAMIDEGALEGVEAAFALHVLASIPAGRIALSPGPVLAGGDVFKATFHGKGGHGAIPHLAVDALAPACQTVLTLQSVATKEFDAKDPLVITVGQLHGGTRFNVVANEAWFDGTARYYRPELAAEVESKVRRVVEATAAAYRTSAEVSYRVMVPPTVNDPQLTGIARDALRGLFGDAALVPLDPTMGGEDFAFFAQRVPATYIGIGSSNPEKGVIHPNHHPQFDIDESCLETAVATYAGVARAFLALDRR
jgi:amidohydrolase